MDTTYTTQRKEYYEKNKERINEERRSRYLNDKEYRKNTINRNIQYYEKNKDKLYEKRKGYYIEYYQSLREYKITQQLARYHNIRKNVVKFLGEKCVKCGNSDFRVLQVDHVNGGGGKERKANKNYSHQLENIVKKNKENYQLLCANCNIIKIYENGEHKSKFSP